MSSWNDFYNESFPPDPDEDMDEDTDEEADGESRKDTDWMGMWALCVSNGITDSEWINMTIPKVRALMKAKNRKEEFEIMLHGGKIENKKPKKAKYLSDLGFYPK
ncbi:hypothetical protein BVG16_13525 [Paenibacillus selenitireducens]|uniref:Uncharacterized protein n=1 Tax=Paenibacillus selenitireducens TaxID=1324314 RepID=A0A1T2XC99_9BACL|nr:hypothetical protein [Paenibacillus selenitireducens]OPA77470.1 hypothetical protein BVG16_13525 [Paenibacillus selenitireducens]